jgi:hypothetical protein
VFLLLELVVAGAPRPAVLIGRLSREHFVMTRRLASQDITGVTTELS